MILLAFKRGDLIAIVFDINGNANVFNKSLSESAEWSLICFDGRQRAWKPIDVEEAKSEAEKCGLNWCWESSE